jgi:hypothetical protein
MVTNFGSGELPILGHYGMLHRRLRDTGKSQPMAAKIKIKSVAQHQGITRLKEYL